MLFIEVPYTANFIHWFYIPQRWQQKRARGTIAVNSRLSELLSESMQSSTTYFLTHFKISFFFPYSSYFLLFSFHVAKFPYSKEASLQMEALEKAIYIVYWEDISVCIF